MNSNTINTNLAALLLATLTLTAVFAATISIACSNNTSQNDPPPTSTPQAVLTPTTVPVENTPTQTAPVPTEQIIAIDQLAAGLAADLTRLARPSVVKIATRDGAGTGCIPDELRRIKDHDLDRTGLEFCAEQWRDVIDF